MRYRLKNTRISATAVDLFCGAGGLTRGLMDAGVTVAAGYDVDEACRFPYESNNKPAQFHNKSVVDLTADELALHYPNGHVRILVGCAPCQTFSKYTQGLENADDPKWTLLDQFARLVREFKPDVLSMENVPELQRHSVFSRFLRTLKQYGYNFCENQEKQIVYCPDYGIPQNRRRLVIVASRLGPIELMPPTHASGSRRTVRQALKDLPELSAGEVCRKDPLHRASRLSSINMKRISHSIPGGTWRDWPHELIAKCHRQKTGKSYPGVYGRMEWDKPAPTITTQFYGFGNGRFGHPVQNRAISLREGAILQSFPSGYNFIAKDGEYCMKTVGRLIGNAVPVLLGKTIGISITNHLEAHRV